MTTDKKDWGKEIVQVSLTNEELSAAVSLLDFMAGAFEIMAKAAKENDDTHSSDNLHIRIAFAKAFAAKLNQNLELGDTRNKTFH